MRAIRLWLGLLGAAAVVAGGCAEDKSYAIVNVRLSAGELTGVRQFVVYVENGVRTDLLYYPPTPGGPWRLTTTEKVDFSVSFKASYVGQLRIGVEPRDLNNVLGYGAAEKMIDPGHRVTMDVVVVLGARAPTLGGGGADAGNLSDGVPFSMCEPLTPATCGPNKTCRIDCPGDATPVGACATAGFGKDGDACPNGNSDCEPGTQCFAYGCAKVCRKFCASDAECALGKCNRTVSCGTKVTAHKFCSQSCDPTDGVGNCRNGLSCLLFANEVASCDCADASRVGGDGAPCETTASCKPGFVCISQGTPDGGAPSMICRPLCRLADKTCPVGTTCTELKDYKVYGACSPG